MQLIIYKVHSCRVAIHRHANYDKQSTEILLRCVLAMIFLSRGLYFDEFDGPAHKYSNIEMHHLWLPVESSLETLFFCSINLIMKPLIIDIGNECLKSIRQKCLITITVKLPPVTVSN